MQRGKRGQGNAKKYDFSPQNPRIRQGCSTYDRRSWDVPQDGPTPLSLPLNHTALSLSNYEAEDVRLTSPPRLSLPPRQQGLNTIKFESWSLDHARRIAAANKNMQKFWPAFSFETSSWRVWLLRSAHAQLLFANPGKKKLAEAPKGRKAEGCRKTTASLMTDFFFQSGDVTALSPFGLDVFWVTCTYLVAYLSVKLPPSTHRIHSVWRNIDVTWLRHHK